MHVCPVILHYTLMCHIPNKKSLVSAEVSKNFPFLTSTHIILLWLLCQWKNLIFWMDRIREIRNHLHISHKVSLEQEIWSCSLFETWDSTHIYQSVYYQRSIIYQPQKIPQRFKLCHIVPLSLVLYLMSPFKKLQLVAWLHFPTFTFDWELELVFFCHS